MVKTLALPHSTSTFCVYVFDIQSLTAGSKQTTEADYPYTGIGTAACNASLAHAGVVSVTGHIDVAQNETAMQVAILQQPIVAAIDAEWSFQFYSGGM